MPRRCLHESNREAHVQGPRETRSMLWLLVWRDAWLWSRETYTGHLRRLDALIPGKRAAVSRVAQVRDQGRPSLVPGKRFHAPAIPVKRVRCRHNHDEAE